MGGSFGRKSAVAPRRRGRRRRGGMGYSFGTKSSVSPGRLRRRSRAGELGGTYGRWNAARKRGFSYAIDRHGWLGRRGVWRRSVLNWAGARGSVDAAAECRGSDGGDRLR